MRFEWDEEKNQLNLAKHGVGFEAAELAFDDIHALTQPDPFSEDEERWITLGAIGPQSLLFVVHTWFDRNQEEIIRIISARPATPRERRRYEEAHQRSTTRHRGRRR
jgi:hypothetical protein